MSVQTQPQTPPPNLSAFRAITNFVFELNRAFPAIKSIVLYKHLVERTTVSHEIPISKHNAAFKAFCEANEEAIEKKDFDSLRNTKIAYSDKVYIELADVFAVLRKNRDKDTENVVWQHLLAISAYVNPTSNATKILKETLSKENSKEGQLISNFITKIGNTIDADTMSNPMTALMTIFSSGVLTEFMTEMESGIQSGNIDLSSIRTTMDGLMGNLTCASNISSNISSAGSISINCGSIGSAGSISINCGSIGVTSVSNVETKPELKIEEIDE